ncbi:MAG TPA: aminotransferase class V-fold PLP-dependent enzyme [Phycisphaerae bacterium]|nr:aminotransferase class V-fold PLP-dependent enzyme [Phycisphaerae bacterium]HNU46551.1 aminotransferase class V-fold PLP-dependent enzyme [Phycisphaerae bacterium]
MIYLDNAATSWPKPPGVADAMVRFLRDVGASPGRSGHALANEAERIRLDAREAVAELLGLRNPLRVVFTANATAALNLVLHGLLTPGAHVVISGMEHNAVMRPLRSLETGGAAVTIVPCGADGALTAADIEEYLRPTTRLLVVNHASNVCGTVQPVGEIAALARRHGIALLVDAAQTGGCRPIDVTGDGIDLLAFSGHKGLLGPTGTGGLVIHEDFDIDRLPALIQGGTGSRSEHERQPDFLPDKYEAGTPNIVGLAGLAAGVRFVLERGVEAIRRHEQDLTGRLLAGLREIAGVRILGPQDAGQRAAVVSFTVAGRASSDVAYELEQRFGVLCRPGLHCAPLAHRTLGTLPGGTVRFAPGLFNTVEQIAAAVDAVREVAGAATHG